MISAKSQRIVWWWSLAFFAGWGTAFVFLLHMLPAPRPTDTAEQVARWYQTRSGDIKLGATLTSYCAGWFLPMFAVLAMQIARQERGKPIWATLCAAGGAMMSIFVALPPIFWGVAAFTPDRDPDVTKAIHELGMLTFITTDQFFIFNWVALIVVCFLPQTAPHSPFPRWYGYFNIWVVLIFECGAPAWNFLTGPFAWNGLASYWFPVSIFLPWVIPTTYLLMKNLRLQMREADAQESAPADSVVA